MPFHLGLPTGWRQAGSHVPIKSMAVLSTLLLSLNGLDGKTLKIVAAASPLFQEPVDIHNKGVRLLAGNEKGSEVCNNPASFLGVGNVACLNDNLQTSVFLMAVIVAVSIIVEKLIHHTRATIKCPQLLRIVNRIFEEVMIMGFLSMVIFTLNTSGAMRSLALNNLTTSEKLHFYEFFHYIVFLTMIYFIVIVLLLLFIGTVVPKLVWDIKNHSDHRRETMSDIHHTDTYQSQFPSFTGSSSDIGNRSRMRHSFIRDVSALGRDLNPYSVGNSFIDDVDPDTPGGDNYLAMRAQDGMYSSFAMRARALSGMDLVVGSRTYSLLLQRYHREGCCFHLNIRKQWNLWKSLEILAYNICQNRSGYIYKNPIEMERLFGVRPTSSHKFRDAAGTQGEHGTDHEDDDNRMTYAKYHVLCMRNLLLHMTNIPPSAFLILLVISVLPSIFPHEDHWIFIGVGALLLLVNVVIFFKVLKILREIVDDRLRIISMREIQARLAKALKKSSQNRAPGHLNVPVSDSAPGSGEESVAEDPNHDQITLHARHKKAPKKFKAAALAVRAVIRLQMSALDHRQLHYHDNRFWFNSPRFLLRVFQFATIGQAFYLVWLSLVEIPSMLDSSASNGGGSALLALMIFYPALALLVITPLTMPSLVLVMSLTGIFVDLNASNGDAVGNHRNVTEEETKTHTRMIRRSFLKSHYTEGGSHETPPLGPGGSPNQRDGVATPTNVFLRMYDSPVSSINTRRMDSEPRFFPADGNSDYSRNQSRTGSIGNTSGNESGYSSRRGFDLAAFQSVEDAAASAGTETTTRPYGQTSFQSASSFTSSTGSAYKSPRPTRMETGVPGSKMRWSQANVEPELQVAVDNNEQENDLEQAQSPVSASFKTYCSKYGGYPDL